MDGVDAARTRFATDRVKVEGMVKLGVPCRSGEVEVLEGPGEFKRKAGLDGQVAGLSRTCEDGWTAGLDGPGEGVRVAGMDGACEGGGGRISLSPM